MARTEAPDRVRDNPTPLPAGSKMGLVSELVTYLASEEGSPATVQFAGYTFRANIPQRVEMSAEWFDMVRGNKFFVVGEFKPDELRPAPPAEIKTDKQYRAHVERWLKQVNSTHELIRQWVRDTQLRHMCDVGSDDYDLLGSLIEPRLAELAKMDGLNDRQVAAIWVENGIFQKPWKGVNAVEVKEAF